METVRGVAKKDVDEYGFIKPYARSQLLKSAVFVRLETGEDTCDKCLFNDDKKYKTMCVGHMCSDGVWMNVVDAAMHKLENA